MNILHVYKTYIPDDFTGIPRVIYELCKGLEQYNVHSEVFCLSSNPQPAPLIIEGHEVHQAKTSVTISSSPLSYEMLKKFKKLVNRFDLIHYHYPWPPGDLLHLLYGKNKVNIVTYHSDIVRQKILKNLYSPLQNIFLNSVNHIIATSPNYLMSSPILQKYQNKTSIIPIGISPGCAIDEAVLKKWQSRVGNNFLLFVGSHRYYKGLIYLLDAARKVNVPIVIAGSGSIKQGDAPPNVKIVGEVSEADKHALLSLCCGLVLPSTARSEAFGIALVEAAQAGKPAVSTELSTGSSYVNIHGETGLVVRPSNSEELCAAMLELYENTNLSRQLGEAARLRYECNFTSMRMCKSHFALYNKQLKGDWHNEGQLADRI